MASTAPPARKVNYAGRHWRKRILTCRVTHWADAMDEKILVITQEADVAEPRPSGAVRHVGLPGLIERLASWRIVLGVCVLACFAYATSLAGDFVLDDLDVVLRNPDIQSWSNIEHAFTTHLW